MVERCVGNDCYGNETLVYNLRFFEVKREWFNIFVLDQFYSKVIIENQARTKYYSMK